MLTMSPCRVKQQEKILKTGKFSFPAEMRRSIAARTRCGREFEARAAATGKARSPIVVWHVDGSSRETDSVERSCSPEERLDAGRMHSLRYCGAVPLRQRYVSTHSRNWIRSGTLSQCSSSPEADVSCEQICSPRRPASPKHLARTENGSVRLQVHQDWIGYMAPQLPTQSFIPLGSVNK